MKFFDEFKKQLEIDKLSLDDEIINQPQLFCEVSEKYAEAISIRDALKEELAVIDASVDSELRKNSEKITEPRIKSRILLDKRHTVAFAKYLNAKLEADMLGVLKDSYEQRSDALKRLANLYVANYYDNSSIQATSSQDKAVYSQRRRILAKERERKDEL